MTGDNPLRVYFVVGEESGDVLGTKLIDAFEEMGSPVKPMGLAGAKMQDKGMDSLFDIAELSVMGISAVVKNLPNLLKRIRQTVDDILAKKPDVLLLIDSPDFSYRVAKKVRQEAPNIKIIKYVAPTVWAWRSGRAKKIKPYIDHIMAILPFEPQLMKKLGGPEATYVGHPLASELPNIQTANKMACHDVPRLVILPGSRKGELKLMLPVIRDTIQILHERGNKFELTLPAVTRLEADIRQETSGWIIKPTIVTGEEAKKKAFTNADLALATSGTVILELALYKVPMVSIYKLDKMMMAVRHMITAWTTLLPNLIVDYPFIPEKINENAHPEHLARMLERLMMSGEERNVQLKGFELLEEKLASEQLGAKVAARKIIELLAE